MSPTRQEILERLFLDHRDELESLLRRRVNCRDTAAELSQEAFLKVCLSENLDCIRNLKAYLFRTALNLLTDYYRYRGVRDAVSVDLPPEELPEPEDPRSAEAVYFAQTEVEALRAALGELSPLCQRIFYLSRFEGRKQREIAEALGISVRTVEDNLKRALVHCARRLES